MERPKVHSCRAKCPAFTLTFTQKHHCTTFPHMWVGQAASGLGMGTDLSEAQSLRQIIVHIIRRARKLTMAHSAHPIHVPLGCQVRHPPPMPGPPSSFPPSGSEPPTNLDGLHPNPTPARDREVAARQRRAKGAPSCPGRLQFPHHGLWSHAVEDEEGRHPPFPRPTQGAGRGGCAWYGPWRTVSSLLTCWAHLAPPVPPGPSPHGAVDLFNH